MTWRWSKNTKLHSQTRKKISLDIVLVMPKRQNQIGLKKQKFRSHTAYTSALKNDLLLNPNLVEAERKFLQAFGMALS
ncbi:hypothetical protein ckin116_01800 [Helicobacter pylori]